MTQDALKPQAHASSEPLPADWEPTEIAKQLYRVLLRREPEGRELQQSLSRPFAQALQELVTSRGFLGQVFRLEGEEAWRFANALRPRVDVDVPPETLQPLLDVMARVWSGYGRNAPYWSVCTEPLFLGQLDEARVATFYNSGMTELTFIARILHRCDISIDKLSTALEFGCGVGRVSLWLTQVFPTVYGVDISPGHLELATDHLRRHQRNNFIPIRIATVEEIACLPRFDFFFTRLVLQHNPPPVIKLILERLLYNLEPGGVGIFQLPIATLDYEFAIEQYLARAHYTEHMELHALPQVEVFRLIGAAGCRVLEVFPDYTLGTFHWSSLLFVVQKT
jgi:SAM-dependent methyltransferase